MALNLIGAVNLLVGGCHMSSVKFSSSGRSTVTNYPAMNEEAVDWLAEQECLVGSYEKQYILRMYVQL